MRKEDWGGIKMKEGKVFSLAYADDVVLLTEEEEGMRRVIRVLERYLDRKSLELNSEKSKIMRFKK